MLLEAEVGAVAATQQLQLVLLIEIDTDVA